MAGRRRFRSHFSIRLKLASVRRLHLLTCRRISVAYYRKFVADGETSMMPVGKRFLLLLAHQKY
jgi:hypothetical protein